MVFVYSVVIKNMDPVCNRPVSLRWDLRLT